MSYRTTLLTVASRTEQIVNEIYIHQRVARTHALLRYSRFEIEAYTRKIIPI